MARILIVDDDEVLAELLTELLAQSGHMVSAVHHGDEAVKAAEVSSPDLIILDYVLPGKSGMEILRELRRMPAMVEVPIMMLTGKLGKLLPARAGHDGADDYLNKPFLPEDLVARVEAMLKGGALLRGMPH